MRSIAKAFLPPRKSCQRQWRFYAEVRSDAALASFMEKATRLVAGARRGGGGGLNQFCGLPANGAQPNVDDERPKTLADSAAPTIAASGERAVADGLHVESDRDQQPAARALDVTVKSGRAT